jgi:hypothetical protein
MAWFTLCIWLASAVANDVYGKETFPTDPLLWRLSADLPDIYGLQAPRVNVPLLGVIGSGLVFLTVQLLRNHVGTPGALFSLFLTLTGFVGLLLVPLQANAVPYLFRVRLDWWFYLALTGCGVSILFALRYRARRTISMRAKD